MSALAATSQLPDALFEPFSALCETLLLRCTPPRLIRAIVGAGPSGAFPAQAALRIRELLRLELEFPRGTPPVVRLRAPHPLLHIAKAFCGPAPARACLLRIFSTQFARGALHLLGCLPEVTARLLTF